MQSILSKLRKTRINEDRDILHDRLVKDMRTGNVRSIDRYESTFHFLVSHKEDQYILHHTLKSNAPIH